MVPGSPNRSSCWRQCSFHPGAISQALSLGMPCRQHFIPQYSAQAGLVTHCPIEIETVRAGSYEVAYALPCRLSPLNTRVMMQGAAWKTSRVQAKTLLSESCGRYGRVGRVLGRQRLWLRALIARVQWPADLPVTSTLVLPRASCRRQSTNDQHRAATKSTKSICRWVFRIGSGISITEF